MAALIQATTTSHLDQSIAPDRTLCLLLLLPAMSDFNCSTPCYEQPEFITHYSYLFIIKVKNVQFSFCRSEIWEQVIWVCSKVKELVVQSHLMFVVPIQS